MIRALLFLAALSCVGCTTVARGPFPLASDPAPTIWPTTLDAWFAAEVFAYQENGHVYEIEPTGSMEPTLHAKDLVVVVPKPWAEYVPFKIALYDPDWSGADAFDCIHRIWARKSDGLIMWGDANPFAETLYRVTEQKAKGLLVGIWRVSP